MQMWDSFPPPSHGWADVTLVSLEILFLSSGHAHKSVKRPKECLCKQRSSCELEWSKLSRRWGQLFRINGDMNDELITMNQPRITDQDSDQADISQKFNNIKYGSKWQFIQYLFRLLIFTALRYKALKELGKRVLGLYEFLQSRSFWTNSYGFHYDILSGIQ